MSSPPKILASTSVSSSKIVPVTVSFLPGATSLSPMPPPARRPVYSLPKYVRFSPTSRRYILNSSIKSILAMVRSVPANSK